jgi:hypothetical protein
VRGYSAHRRSGSDNIGGRTKSKSSKTRWRRPLKANSFFGTGISRDGEIVDIGSRSGYRGAVFSCRRAHRPRPGASEAVLKSSGDGAKYMAKIMDKYGLKPHDAEALVEPAAADKKSKTK